MAYANSITYFGWDNGDVATILTKLVDKDCTKLITKSEKNVVALNKKIAEKKLPFKYDVFKGGMGSKAFEPYLYFDKIIENQSCNSDDISTSGFDLKEIKKLLDTSFKFSKDFTGCKPPGMYTKVNADDK
jgi:hypothetical protein